MCAIRTKYTFVCIQLFVTSTVVLLQLLYIAHARFCPKKHFIFFNQGSMCINRPRRILSTIRVADNRTLFLSSISNIAIIVELIPIFGDLSLSNAIKSLYKRYFARIARHRMRYTTLTRDNINIEKLD